MTTYVRTLVYAVAAKRRVPGAGGWSNAPFAPAIRAA
jgi:hypothetical protein